MSMRQIGNRWCLSRCRTDGSTQAAADRPVDRIIPAATCCAVMPEDGENRIDPGCPSREEPFLNPATDRPYGRGRGSDRSGRWSSIVLAPARGREARRPPRSANTDGTCCRLVIVRDALPFAPPSLDSELIPAGCVWQSAVEAKPATTAGTAASAAVRAPPALCHYSSPKFAAPCDFEPRV